MPEASQPAPPTTEVVRRRGSAVAPRGQLLRATSSTVPITAESAFSPNTRRCYDYFAPPATQRAAVPVVPSWPTVFQSQVLPVLGALPAVAAGVATVRLSLERGATMAPRHRDGRQAKRALAPALVPPRRPAPSADALLALVRRYGDRLELENRALARAMEDDQFKVASATLETASILCVTFPGAHALLGLHAGCGLSASLVAVIPPLFALHGCLHVAYYAGRFAESLSLWLPSRRLRTSPSLLLVSATPVHEALARECVYFACQTFFWAALTLGMVLGTGIVFASAVAARLGIVVLVMGVAGTTLLHLGWANRFGVPEGIDVAPPSVFGGRDERLRRLGSLDAELEALDILRHALAMGLPPNRRHWYAQLWRPLMRLPSVDNWSAWWVDRWLRQDENRLDGAAIIGALAGLCQVRIEASRRDAKASGKLVKEGLRALQGDAQDPRFDAPLLEAARSALEKEQVHLTEAQTSISRHLSFARQIQHPLQAHTPWQGVVQQWITAQGVTLGKACAAQALMTHLVHWPCQAIRYERALLLWTDRLAYAESLRPATA
jgi:hypothetical protein